MVTSGIASIVNPGHSAHRRNENRGVMWADVLGEFNTTDERRFETFRVKPSTPRYSDFRFYRREFEEALDSDDDANLADRLQRSTALGSAMHLG